MSIFAKVNDSVGSVLESVVENCNTIETLEEGVFNYKPSMIPVAARETGEGTKYIVEFDMLQKLAGYENSSITEAFEAVCMENCIDAEDVYVFVSEGTCNLISESYVNDYDTGTIMSIDNGIKSLAEAGVNMLMAESVKFKFFKFDKIDDEHPELKSIKKELKELNKYTNANGEALYKNKNSAFGTILKILRVISTVVSNVTLVLGPFSLFLTWIYTVISKLIIYCIDNHEYDNIQNDVDDVINKLNEIKSKSDNDDFKNEIEKHIENLRKKIDKANPDNDD